MMTAFKKGQTVMVYQDPLTEKKEEGKAVLSCFNSSYYELERWQVRFIGEERFVERSIAITGKNKKEGLRA